MTTPIVRRLFALSFATAVLAATPSASTAAEGELRYGLHVTLASKWLDPADTEAFQTQIQKIMHDGAMNVPIYELAFIWGLGPRVGESTAGAIGGYPYTEPIEDLTLKK